MNADRFRLVSHWRIDAPIERVYATLLDVGALSKWWNGVSSELVHSSSDVVGTEARIELRSLGPFRLRARVRIESAEPNREIRVVSHGDLEGTGTWRLRPAAHGTDATFTWDVQLRHAWLRPLARALRPLLVFTHDVAMRKGERGLRRLLGERSERG